MQEISFDEAVAQIQQKDPRYHREAYLFVREALDYTQKSNGKEKRSGTRHGAGQELVEGVRVRHVTGQELLAGIREIALEQFGPMAATVLGEWGVDKCEDFGEIVFNMIEIGLLAKTEKDSRADFAGGYSFHEAFAQPFLPRSKSDSLRHAPVKSGEN